MSIDTGSARWEAEYRDDIGALLRLQNIMLQAAEGSRDVNDAEYQALRRALLRNHEYSDVIPPLLRLNRDLPSMWAEFKSFSPQWAPRRERVREELSGLFDRAERLDTTGTAGGWVRPDVPVEEATDASDWTGVQSRVSRLKVVRGLLPLAQAAVEALIANLSEPGGNGGPLLDERAEALEQLRELHRTLGALLSAVEAGHFDDELGQNLAAEAARYAKRAARALRHDPMPYLSSALLLGIFSACGLPGIGGYLGGVAVTVKKNALRKAAHSESEVN